MQPMYDRDRHNVIAAALQNLKSELLLDHECYFGGGTAIAMKYGEYRTSFDIDFLIQNPQGYRELRQMVKQEGLNALFSKAFNNVSRIKSPQLDQYGIRGSLDFMATQIKFEIVLEGRIKFEKPDKNDVIEGVATLTETDLLAEKLLANSDRYMDDGVFSRDLIDLAFMNVKKISTTHGYRKAQDAYGEVVLRDLERAIQTLEARPNWLDRCIDILEIQEPRAVVLKKVTGLLK